MKGFALGLTVAEIYDNVPDISLGYLHITKEIEATERILHTLRLADETPVIALGRRLYGERLAELQAALAAVIHSSEIEESQVRGR